MTPGAAQQRTIVVPDRLAYRTTRFALAQAGSVHTHVVTLPALASQLAGGLLRVASDLHVLAALRQGTLPELTAFGAVAQLPGFARAATSSVQSVWESGAEPETHSESARWVDIWRLSHHIEQHLPPGTVPLPTVVAAAISRAPFAPAITGAVHVHRVGNIPALYHPLLTALAAHVPVSWHAPTGSPPTWWPAGAPFTTPEKTTPEVHLSECANPAHEITEALRWARSLIAAGTPPGDIAIVAADVRPYEPALLALAPDVDIPLHFANGSEALTARSGQRAAALAAAWLRPYEPEARAYVQLQFGEHTADILEQARNTPHTSADGRALGLAVLSDTALSIWLRALEESPPQLLEATLQRARIDDQREPSRAVIVCTAAQFAGSPRPMVRAMGVNAGRWPRRGGIDPLLPAAFIDGQVTHAELDQHNYEVLIAAATHVSLSYARRDETGGVLTRSPLLPDVRAAERLLIPETAHAASLYDRRFLSPSETRNDPIISAAHRAWRNWHVRTVTAHDGVLKPGNERLLKSVTRVHSATSLTLLISDPLVFFWRYTLGWQEPEWDEPFALSPKDFGAIVHTVLEHAVRLITELKPLPQATERDIAVAVQTAVRAVRESWERPPPRLLFERQLREVHHYARTILEWPTRELPGQLTFTEVPFGTTADPVRIPGTELPISGVIDRLDISADGQHIRVIDYKTGGQKPPKDVAHGTELQRVLYTFAARTMYPEASRIEALLFNPRFPGYVPLAQPEIAESEVVTGITAALELLAAGRTVPGLQPGPFQFAKIAFPADQTRYLRRKEEALSAEFADIFIALGVPGA